MEQNHLAHDSAFVPEAATDEPASSNNPLPREMLGFEPVPVRRRIDGWTLERQRDYVEALADTGVARQAAAIVGMTEQSASRLRRRADARSFDRTCEAAMRIGARRLVSVAFERAIEGTIKQHFYHGELKGEERVYDNRLLIALLSKLGLLLAPTQETDDVLRNWEPWMEAVEQGLPEPPPPPEPEPEPEPIEAEEEEEDDEPEEHFHFDGEEVWKDGEFGVWWTRFPPPTDFDGLEYGVWNEEGYQRSLTPQEQEVAEAEAREESEEEYARDCRRRDYYFGFDGEGDESQEPEVFEPIEAELSELYEPSAEPHANSVAICRDGEARTAGRLDQPNPTDGAALPRRPLEQQPPNPEPDPHIPRIRLL